MSVLQQIQEDARHLKFLIFRASIGMTQITRDGQKLSGKELKTALTEHIESTQQQLDSLNLILESGIIPDKYSSIVDGLTYYPSPEELEKKHQPLPLGKHTFLATKKSRKTNTKDQRSIFTVCDEDDALSIFAMEHNPGKKYPGGGFAQKVKKGYSESESDTPKYAVKIFKKDKFAENTFHELRIAMRAAYCYRQLGRQGLAFRHNDKQYLVSNWIIGANLDEASQTQIQSMPVERRILMSISLLRELKILHKLGIMHHDIKPSNIMVNYGWLGFIDLDSVMLKGNRPDYGSSPIYTSIYLPYAQAIYDAEYNPSQFCKNFDETYDIYAMGLSLIHLFQEIYIPQEISTTVNVTDDPAKLFTVPDFRLRHGSQYAEHPGLKKILRQMITGIPQAFTSVDEILEQLQELLTTYPNHTIYLHEERLAGVGDTLTPSEGAQAFKEIEVELLGFNQRIDSMQAQKETSSTDKEAMQSTVQAQDNIIDSAAISQVANSKPFTPENKAALASLLDALEHLPENQRAQHLFTALTKSIARSKSTPGRHDLLEALKKCPQSVQIALFKQQNNDGNNVLCIALQSHSFAIPELVDIMSQFNIDDKLRILNQLNNKGLDAHHYLTPSQEIALLIDPANQDDLIALKSLHHRFVYPSLIKALGPNLIEPLIRGTTTLETLSAIIANPHISDEQLSTILDNPVYNAETYLKIVNKNSRITPSNAQFESFYCKIQSYLHSDNLFNRDLASDFMYTIRTSYDFESSTIDKLDNAIDKLRVRAHELMILSMEEKKDNLRAEAQAAFALYNELKKIPRASISSDQQEKNTMSKNIRDAIKKFEPTFKKDLVFKQIVYDILNALLIIGCALQYAITGEFRLFKAKTKSTMIIEDITRNIEPFTTNKLGRT